MPYEIETKDGIVIRNIPDDVDPNSEELKARVNLERQRRDSPPAEQKQSYMDTLKGSLPNGRAAAPTDDIDELGRFAKSIGVAVPQLLDMPSNLVNWMLKKAGVSAQVPGASGVLDAGLSVASGIAAEPIAGLAGIAQSVNPMAEPGAGANAVRDVREAMTYSPKTESGQRYMQGVAQVAAPVADAIGGAEDWLGDAAFDATGSPAIAAAAKTAPTAIMEILGLGASKYMNRAGKAAKSADRFMASASPSVEKLREASTAIYKEIDDMGAVVKPNAYSGFASKIEAKTAKMGIDADITPAASKAVRRVTELVGQDVPISELEKLREVARGAANSLNKKEAALGNTIIDSIDDFLDTSGSSSLSAPANIDVGEIGKRYDVARDLWGRMRKSEMVQQAIADAELQASGIENGIRIQIRQILKNPKKRKFFNESDIEALRQVEKGTTSANLAKLLGRFGMSEGKATNVLGGSIGGAAGAGVGSAVGGPVGAAVGAGAVMGGGQLSRKLAQRITAGNAKFADDIVRAGKSGKEITRAYFANTPVASRRVSELSELLAMPDVALDLIGNDDFVRKAIETANRQKAMASAAVAGASKPATDQEQ